MGNGQKKETNDITDLCWNQSVCISVVFAVIYLEAFFNHGKIYWQFFGIACVFCREVMLAQQFFL